VGKRYRGYDNLVWLIGGDRNPDTARDDVDVVVRGIKEFDSRHLLADYSRAPSDAVFSDRDQLRGRA